MYIERPVLKIKKKPNEKELSLGAETIEQHLLMSNIMQPFYIKELLLQQDWSCFEKAKEAKKSRAYKVQAMVGLIMYGLMQGISSLRDLSRMARVDLGCIWLTGGIFPDYSSISRFINKHSSLLTEEFFTHLTRSILKVTRSGVRSLAGDGTIIEAAASRYSLLKHEAITSMQKTAHEQLERYPEKTSLITKATHLDKASETIEARIKKRKEQRKSTDSLAINPHEPDAVVQPSKKCHLSVPSYKPSVLANESRIVVAVDVHASNEVSSLMSMLNQMDKNELQIEELLVDGAYGCHEVLEESIKRNISLLCSSGLKKNKKNRRR